MTEPIDILTAAHGVFEDLYKDEHTTNLTDQNVLLDQIDKVLTQQHKQKMEEPLSEAEIWLAIKGLQDEKTPGPDGR